MEKIADYITQRPISKKDRRHNGWVYHNLTIRAPKQFIIDNCLEPEPYWDDWEERRDGIRDYLDWKKIKKLPHIPCCDNGYPTEKQAVVDRLIGFKRDIC